MTITAKETSSQLHSSPGVVLGDICLELYVFPFTAEN
jgi:hypothetical protein